MLKLTTPGLRLYAELPDTRSTAFMTSCSFELASRWRPLIWVELETRSWLSAIMMWSTFKRWSKWYILTKWQIMEQISSETWHKSLRFPPLVVAVTQVPTHTRERGESHSLLFLHFVGGSEVIKQLAVHLHEGLQHVVDQGHDGPEGRGRMRRCLGFRGQEKEVKGVKHDMEEPSGLSDRKLLTWEGVYFTPDSNFIFLKDVLLK